MSLLTAFSLGIMVGIFAMLIGQLITGSPGTDNREPAITDYPLDDFNYPVALTPTNPGIFNKEGPDA